jgi:hypothetical protein
LNRVRAYAAELVKLAPDVLLANSTPVMTALRQTTTSIPIVSNVQPRLANHKTRLQRSMIEMNPMQTIRIMESLV